MALNVEGPSTTGGVARGINVLLGSWLLVSAFVWAHTAPERANSWIVGALIIAVAVVAENRSPARRLNTALAIWLFASVWFLPHHSRATEWNNALVAVAVFLLSLVPGEERDAAPTRTAA